MKFICLFAKRYKIYYNIDQIDYLNILPAWGKEFVYGELFLKDGQSYSIDFDDEKNQEFLDVICGGKTIINFTVIEPENEDE